MIQVDIRSIAAGTCSWCGREKDEVLHFAFQDKSFAGAMCWNDFKRALKLKMPATVPVVARSADTGGKT